MTQLQQTEASCLLQGGALYRSRVGLVSASGPEDLLFAGFKKGAFSLYFGDAPIYHFDLEGRWQRAYVDVTHYLKSLDTSVHAIDRVREGANLVLRRRALRDDEIRDLDVQVRGIALGLIAELDGGRLRRQEPPTDKAQPWTTRPCGIFWKNRPLGCRGLGCSPSAVPGDLWPPPFSAAGLPERGRLSGHAAEPGA